MDLSDLAFSNLKFLLDLEKTDVILSNRRTFYKQDEFVQVDNVQELEHTIYFTFNHLLHMNHNREINFKELLDDIDLAIDQIYENDYFHKLLEEEDKGFLSIIKDIDEYFRDVKDESLNKTICNRMMDRFVNFSEMMGDFMRASNLVLMHYQGLDDDDNDLENYEDVKGDEDTGETNPNLVYSDDSEGDNEGDDEKEKKED